MGNKCLCHFCRSELVWNNDFTFEDYGIFDNDGIFAVLTCSNEECNAIFEGYLSLPS